jgi:hypothetical protein
MGMCSVLDHFALAMVRATFQNHIRTSQTFLGWGDLPNSPGEDRAIFRMQPVNPYGVTDAALGILWLDRILLFPCFPFQIAAPCRLKKVPFSNLTSVPYLLA